MKQNEKDRERVCVRRIASSHIHLIFIDDEHNTDDCGEYGYTDASRERERASAFAFLLYFYDKYATNTTENCVCTCNTKTC